VRPKPLARVSNLFKKACRGCINLAYLSRDYWVLRRSELVDSSWYKNRYPDADSFPWGSVAHYLLLGTKQGYDPNPLFATSYYLGKNPDVAAAGVNPLSHYFRRGAAEGRNAGPCFDSAWYLQHYPDVARARINPLLHYLKQGAAEGRTSFPRFPALPEDPTTSAAYIRECKVLRAELTQIIETLSSTIAIIVRPNGKWTCLERTLDSIRNQIYKPAEVVIVDDDLWDQRPLSLISAMESQRIHVCRQKEGSPGAVRNGGSRVSLSEFVMFVDSGTQLAPETLALLILELKANANTAYAYPQYIHPAEHVRPLPRYNGYDILWHNIAHCALVRTNCFRDCELVEATVPRNGEEWQYWISLLGRGAFGHAVPVPLLRLPDQVLPRASSTHQTRTASALLERNQTLYSPEALLLRKIQWLPSVSVIVSACEDVCGSMQTLQSLSDQTIADFELILHFKTNQDGNSFLDSSCSAKGVKIFSCEPRTLSEALTAVATSEYFVFLRSHVLLDKSALEKLVITAALHEKAHFLYPNAVPAMGPAVPGDSEIDKSLSVNIADLSLIRRDAYVNLAPLDRESLISKNQISLKTFNSLTVVTLPENLTMPSTRPRPLADCVVAPKYAQRSLELPLTVRRVESGNLPITCGFASLYNSYIPTYPERSKDLRTPTPFQPRYWGDERRSILYCIPFCTIGGAEKVDLDILSGLPRDQFRVTLITTLKHEQEWLSRFTAVVDEVFSIPDFLASESQLTDLLFYFCVSRNVDLIFNRNTHEGYALGKYVGGISSTVAVADLMHFHDLGADWVKISAAFHNELDERIVISHDLKTHAAKVYGLPAEDFTVIQNGIDTTRLLSESQSTRAASRIRASFGIPPNAALIGYVGRFSAEKDPLRWIEVAATVAQNISLTHFIMVGDGELRSETENLIGQFNLGDRIHLAGYRDNVDEFFAAMTVLLMTSRYEGLPLVSLEAMLQGVPVISTNVGAAAECISPDVGRLLPPDASPATIAEEVISLMDQINRDPLIRSRCTARVLQNFPLERMQGAYRREFEELCSSRDVSKRLKDYEMWYMTNSAGRNGGGIE
jgi:glycosyltransferase involved in cell wall biosynthesis